MAKKLKLDSNAMNILDGMSDKTKESRQKQREPQAAPFKKPRGDYYNLDMIVRDSMKGPKGHPVMIEAIKTNYKEYVTLMAASEGLSITKYIHRLIDEDMEKNKDKYKKIRKANEL